MPGIESHGEFLRHAVLETVVPHATDIDIEGALSSALEGGAEDLSEVLSSIHQRSLLFFGTLQSVCTSCSASYSLTVVQMSLSTPASSLDYRIARNMP